jgi:hypothetical protein
VHLLVSEIYYFASSSSPLNYVARRLLKSTAVMSLEYFSHEVQEAEYETTNMNQ